SASNCRDLPMIVSFNDSGHTRPWYQVLQVVMPVGHLDESDTITVVLGDTSGGSPGLKVQSCAEQDFRFTTLVDVAATSLHIPVAHSPVVPVIAGEPAAWHAVLPSLRRPGEAFRLGVRAEDRWGNPTHLARADLVLEASLVVEGLPERFSYEAGMLAYVFDDLRVLEEGVLRVTVRDDPGEVLALSTPLVVRACEQAGWWADLHGQSGESVGINTARHYFEFAREIAFLDASGHQANDFQINKAFWAHLNDLTAACNEDGRFVTYPGYEWSANTHLGGDRNVYFRHEGRQIHRSSHALLPDRSDIDTDANDAPALFEALKDEDAVVFAHIGGRWADLTRGHDGRLETAMEIHSAWGSFEWLMDDAFGLGFRVGVVANSDGHKGRPGASHPGGSEFAAYGGLTCLLAGELTRDAIFDCLRKRRHFATTGNRLQLDVAVRSEGKMSRWSRDPAVYDEAVKSEVVEAEMGDIVSCDSSAATLSVSVEASSPIEKIEIRNGSAVVATLRPYGAEEVGNRIRVLMSGAERRGKGSRARWKGEARLNGASILAFAPISAWNSELPCEAVDDHTVAFEARTAGNMMGFDLLVDEGPDARLKIETGNGKLDLALAGVGYDEQIFDMGGLKRQLRILRLPETNPHLSFQTECAVSLDETRDNPLWVCVTTEDGHQAWSSPVYVIDA
ncbi:MAG: DUF3604 domain-containing protein, partial [Rhodospirillaceae bacterium]|nr:DUF3604 domain-containing protein [Rhodospirillaceae bacterium]